MNQKSLFLFMMFLTLILAGCQEKSSKSSSSNSNPINSCLNQNYWQMQGCPGFCANNATHASCVGGGTTGTTTGGTTGSTNCSGNNNWNVPGCPGFCGWYPTNAACSGTTVGGTVGGGTQNCTSPIAKTCSNYCTTYPGALGCLPNGTNCWINTTATGCPGSSAPLNPAGSSKYPIGEPQGSCSPSYAIGTGTAAETRKATIISSAAHMYNPLEPITASFLNTSDMLKTVAQAKVFFMTDATLKLRIKVKAQKGLYGSGSEDYCLGRVRGLAQTYGYTKLQYRVSVYGANGSFLGTVGSFETGVNSCTPAIDLSYWKEVFPTGIFISIDQVMSNQNINCQPSAYNGYAGCNEFRTIREADCWGMDLEVAADGTKTFN